MAKLKIFTFPDAVLTKKASPIQRVEKSLYQVADDMLETMYSAPGVGLAANQVGILQRMLVLDTEYEFQESEGECEEAYAKSTLVQPKIIQNKNPQIMINPQIIYRQGSLLFLEGCLSVPEYSAEVKRAEKLKIEYQTIHGKTKQLLVEGLLAVVIQHEIDHLDGKLFIDRLNALKKETVKKKLKEERRLREEQD